MVTGRRRARELALMLLYQLDLSDGLNQGTAQAFLREQKASQPVKKYAQDLFQGVCQHKKEIDELVQKLTPHWSLERMLIVDRNILRLAAYELLFCTDIPEKVAINEAIELGKKFGSEESGAFINAILDKIRLSR